MTTPTTSSLETTRQRATDALEKTADKARELRFGVQDLAHKGLSTVTDSAAAAQKHLGQYAQATTRYVSEQPLKSALIAAAVGATVAGIIIALRRHKGY